MGLQISASLLCDQCNVTTVSIPDPSAPPPSEWCRVQGYATTSGGSSNAIDGYFCPECTVAQGTRNLTKKAADVSPALTSAAVIE